MIVNTWSNVGVPAGAIDVINVNFVDEAIEFGHVFHALSGNVVLEFDHGVVTLGSSDVVVELLTDEGSPVELSDGCWGCVVGPVGYAVSDDHSFEINFIVFVGHIILVVFIDLQSEVWK